MQACFTMRWEDNPPQHIQDIARAYCERRPLHRPDVTYFKVGLKWLAFTLVVLGIARSAQWVLQSESFKGCILCAWPQIAAVLPLLMRWWALLAAVLLAWAAALRWFLIDCIKLYQHYASDDVRGRCIMMPRCSEFAILALRKYGLVIGLYLTYLRVFKRCKGNIYRIEYPSLKH